MNKSPGDVMCDSRICLQRLEINETLIVLCKSGLDFRLSYDYVGIQFLFLQSQAFRTTLMLFV